MSSLGYGLLVLCLLGLGGYFAATEGVLAAIAGALLPEDLQASGLGMLTTAVSIGNLFSSLVFGALWLELGLHNAVLIFGAALGLAILGAVPLLLRSQRAPVHG
jgi:MFS family permease